MISTVAFLEYIVHAFTETKNGLNAVDQNLVKIFVYFLRQNNCVEEVVI